MNTQKTIILAGFMFLFAIFAAPVFAAGNSCLNCHETLSAFSEKEKELNEVRIKHLQRDVACSLECHATTIDKIAKSNYVQWTNSKHAMFNVTCNNCHGGNSSSEVKETAHTGISRASEPTSPVFYRNVPETCGNCHTNELNQFRDSKHYQLLKALKQAPTCDTCHEPHEFKVLDTDKFEGLCSQCHNADMKIAPSDAPEKAIITLENADKLKNEIKDAEKAVKQAKQVGKDVSRAEAELKKATSIRDNLPVLWHAFDLQSFEKVIDEGLDATSKANKELGMPSTQPSTPGFEIILSIIGIVALCLLMRRR
ncbi:MAG TPA: PGF-CTERM sorting domain-containing protein [Candidatus Limnocylindrales bacterium]|nr:PGF-CTERM sorting domain-containing protein [Candidatus Limnocylindrales bacterium]